MYSSLSTGDLDNLNFPDLAFTDVLSEKEVASLISKASESVLVRDDYKEVMALAKLLMSRDVSGFTFMLKVIASYEEIDPQVTNAAFLAFRGYQVCPSKLFSGHLWYLTAEMLPLCLFSSHLPNATNASVAKAILQAEKEEHFVSRNGNGFGKPVFPQIALTDVPGIDFQDFVGSDSWKF